MDLQTRKNIRLENFDYSQAGAYFVTICTENRKRLFWDDNAVGAIRELPLQGRSDLSKIVGYFKMNVSKRIHSTGYDKEIWQRSFYDHIIRNDEDYLHHLQYINENPKKWENDEYF